MIYISLDYDKVISYNLYPILKLATDELKIISSHLLQYRNTRILKILIVKHIKIDKEKMEKNMDIQKEVKVLLIFNILKYLKLNQISVKYQLNYYHKLSHWNKNL